MGSVGVKSPSEILAAEGELIDTEIDRRQPPRSIHRYPAACGQTGRRPKIPLCLQFS